MEEYARDEEDKTKRLKLQAAQGALANVYFHPDYVTPPNIVFALAGNMMSVEDEIIIARAIWEALQKKNLLSLVIIQVKKWILTLRIDLKST